MKSMYVMSWWFSPYSFIHQKPGTSSYNQSKLPDFHHHPSLQMKHRLLPRFCYWGAKKLRNTTWNLSMKLEVFQATWKNQTWSCKKCNLKSDHEKWHLKKMKKNQKKRTPEKSKNCKEYGQMKPEKYLKRITLAKITWQKANWKTKKVNRKKTTGKNSNRKKSRTKYPEKNATWKKVKPEQKLEHSIVLMPSISF